MKEKAFSHPTLLISGIAGGSASLLPLRSALRRRGIDARIWPTPLVLAHAVGHYSSRLRSDLKAAGSAIGERLNLVGWSMGGYIAVDAMEDPAAAASTRRVITFGTPHDGLEVAKIPRWLGLRVNVSDFAPGSEMLGRHRRLINDPGRYWEFFAVNGECDTLAPGPLSSIPPASALTGPFSHVSLIADPRLFDLIARLVLQP